MKMDFTIKDILEKGEKKDKVTFKGIVKVVYDGVESKTKYTNFKQNIIIKDETAEIKVIYNYKDKEEEYSKDIVGKEIEIVNGTFSEYVNQKGETQKNIFGKLTFKEGEAPKPNATVKSQAITTGILEAVSPQRDMRDISLQRAMEFWTARIGDKMEEQKILTTAEIFYKYLTGKNNIVKVQTKVQKEEEQEKEEKSEIEKEGEEIEKEEKMSAEKITLINRAMELKEENHLTTDQFESYCNGKNIKSMTIEELKELKKVLSEFTTDVSF